MTLTKSYRELVRLDDFYDRFEYLKLGGIVGSETFGFERYLNQTFYFSKEWKRARREAIIRDNGCDIGVLDYPIGGRVYVHHINPVTPEDIYDKSDKLLDLDNLICVSHITHEAIHYGDQSLLPRLTERKPGDTILWR